MASEREELVVGARDEAGLAVVRAAVDLAGAGVRVGEQTPGMPYVEVVGSGTGRAQGRWRYEVTSEDPRHDPMLTFAMTVLALDKRARLAGARAHVGRVDVAPGRTGTVPAAVTCWVEAVAPDAATLLRLAGEVEQQAGDRAVRDGTRLVVVPELVLLEGVGPDDLAEVLAALSDRSPQGR